MLEIDRILIENQMGTKENFTQIAIFVIEACLLR